MVDGLKGFTFIGIAGQAVLHQQVRASQSSPEPCAATGSKEQVHEHGDDKLLYLQLQTALRQHSACPLICINAERAQLRFVRAVSWLKRLFVIADDGRVQRVYSLERRGESGEFFLKHAGPSETRTLLSNPSPSENLAEAISASSRYVTDIEHSGQHWAVFQHVKKEHTEKKSIASREASRRVSPSSSGETATELRRISPGPRHTSPPLVGSAAVAPVHWDVDPMVQRIMDRVHDPVVHECLDRLVAELRSRHGTVHEMLRRLDRNRDGQLSRDELRQGLFEMGVQLSMSELDSVMRAFDRDHSGSIDYLEFYTVLTKHRARPSSSSAAAASVRRVAPSELRRISPGPWTAPAFPAGSQGFRRLSPESAALADDQLRTKLSSVASNHTDLMKFIAGLFCN